MADFHSKMSVCRHELGGGGFNPPTIRTLSLAQHLEAWKQNLLPVNDKVFSIKYQIYLFIYLKKQPRALTCCTVVDNTSDVLNSKHSRT